MIRLGEKVRIAYIIRAHQAPDQLARLIGRLDSSDATFFVHVNRRSPDGVFDRMRALLAGNPRVTWLPRIDCYYGGFSLVRATLSGVLASADLQPMPAYTLLLSAQDYPIKPLQEIHSSLAREQGKSLMHHFALPSKNWHRENGGLDRVHYRHYERLTYRTRPLHLPFVKRTLPRGYRPYGGSMLWALAPDATKYVAEFVRTHADVVRFFKHVKYPDELFFQTVLLNSSLAETITNRELHFIDWSAGSAHPKTLAVADLPRLRDSEKLFARKFDADWDSQILDLLDEQILQPA